MHTVGFKHIIINAQFYLQMFNVASIQHTNDTFGADRLLTKSVTINTFAINIDMQTFINPTITLKHRTLLIG